MRQYFFTLAALTVIGCSGVPPKQNFKNILDAYVGKDISHEPDYGFAARRSLIETHPATGNRTEEVYEMKSHEGPCRYAFIVENSSAARTVMDWKILGDDKGCVVVP